MEKLKKNKFKIFINILTILGTILLILFIVYGIESKIFTSPDALKIFLERLGILGPIIFIIIQIVQVVIPVIPGGISTAVGVLVFGPVYGFIYNYFSIVLGSIIVFLISKKYGMKVIKKIFKQETIDKYIGWLDKKDTFDKLFAFAIFMPVAPDDFLCYLAGITKMSLKRFTLILIVCKPATILAYSLSLSYITKIVIKLFN